MKPLHVIRRLRPVAPTTLHNPANFAPPRQWGANKPPPRCQLFPNPKVVFRRGNFNSLRPLPGDDVITGPNLPPNQLRRNSLNFPSGRAFFHRLAIPSASGSNLLIRRTAWAHVGGFDTRLQCDEDSEIVWRIRKAGFRVAFDRELVVYATDHRRLYRGIWRKSAHSLFCCALLRFNLLPSRWRGYDFGYWSVRQSEEKASRSRLNTRIHQHSS